MLITKATRVTHSFVVPRQYYISDIFNYIYYIEVLQAPISNGYYSSLFYEAFTLEFEKTT